MNIKNIVVIVASLAIATLNGSPQNNQSINLASITIKNSTSIPLTIQGTGQDQAPTIGANQSGSITITRSAPTNIASANSSLLKNSQVIYIANDSGERIASKAISTGDNGKTFTLTRNKFNMFNLK